MIKQGLSKDEKRTVFKPGAKIGPIPPFLRINSTTIEGFCCWSKITHTSIEPLLRQFSCAYSKSLHFNLDSYIQSPAHFLSRIANKVLPIFGECVPHFCFCFYFDLAREISMIDSILKLPQIQSSTGVNFFILGQFNTSIKHFLQIDGIVSWLHRELLVESVSTSSKSKFSKHYRTLVIETDNETKLVVRSDSVEQLIDNIKMVNWIWILFHINVLLD